MAKLRHLATQKVKRRFRHGCHIWVHIEELGSGAAEMYLNYERMLSHVDCKASFRSFIAVFDCNVLAIDVLLTLEEFFLDTFFQDF